MKESYLTLILMQLNGNDKSACENKDGYIKTIWL